MAVRGEKKKEADGARGDLDPNAGERTSKPLVGAALLPLKNDLIFKLTFGDQRASPSGGISRMAIKHYTTKNPKKNGATESHPRGARNLAAASFVCGACVMVLEMAGSRVMAPYMGTSLVVWTSLIGIIMASLSAGYWLGGLVSDKRPEPRLLGRIIMLAALMTAIVAIAANPLLVRFAMGIPNVYFGSVIAALCLFAVPSALLGMVSPFIVKLAIQGLGSTGATVGRFAALSSSGSILGTFLGGFVLISFLSSQTILFIVASFLGAAAFLVHQAGWKTALPAALVSLCLACASEAGYIPRVPLGFSIETLYNTIHIYEQRDQKTGEMLRILTTDPRLAQSAMAIERPNELFHEYARFYDLAFHYRPETKKILLLGGAGYSVPKHISATRPDVSIDVVEIDPGMTEAARKYFELKDWPGLRIFHEDARMFLNREAIAGNLRYDAIFGDAYGTYNIPFHLTTVETMRHIRDMLNGDGVFIMNVITSLDSDLLGGIYASIAASFPRIEMFPAIYPNSFSEVQNIMIAAFASDAPNDPKPESDYIAGLLSHRRKTPYEPKIPAFTDAFAPVEKYTFRF
jgi:spermidine synthase